MARTRSVTAGRNIMSSASSSSVLVKGYLAGGDEMARNLAALEKGVRDELLAAATLAAAQVIAEAWRAQVLGKIGRGPGVAHYADAITALSRPGKNGATAYVGLQQVATDTGEGQPTEYASRFEFGSTKRSRAQFKAGQTIAGRERGATPTLRPAFDESRGRALDTLATKINELIEKAY